MIEPISMGQAVRRMTGSAFSVTESRYAPRLWLDMHRHDIATLTFATGGSFVERVGKAAYECDPFAVVLKPAGELHANSYGRRGALCVIVELFDRDLAATLVRPAHLPRPDARALAMRLNRELRVTDPWSALAVQALLLELGVLSARAARPSAAREPQWLRDLRAWIDDAPAGQITLQEAARISGRHPAHVARAFRQHCGTSIGEHVRARRLTEAARLLERSEEPIAEIAARCGYYDQSHFASAFRAHVGMTPRAYRDARRVPKRITVPRPRR